MKMAAQRRKKIMAAIIEIALRKWRRKRKNEMKTAKAAALGVMNLAAIENQRNNRRNGKGENRNAKA